MDRISLVSRLSTARTKRRTRASRLSLACSRLVGCSGVCCRNFLSKFAVEYRLSARAARAAESVGGVPDVAVVAGSSSLEVHPPTTAASVSATIRKQRRI